MEELKEMAKLSILSGRINDVQEKNIKMYPFVFFNDIEDVKISYSLSKHDKEETYIAYHLTLNEQSNKEHLDKRFVHLESSVRILFWNSLKVQVFMNNKLAYESKYVGQ